MSKIRHRCRKKVTRSARRAFRPWPAFRIVGFMHMTPLLAMRHASGMTLKQISGALGCSHQAISAFESGRADLRAELVKKYAKLVGVNEVAMRRMQLGSKLMFHKREAQRAEKELKALSVKASKAS